MGKYERTAYNQDVLRREWLEKQAQQELNFLVKA